MFKNRTNPGSLGNSITELANVTQGSDIFNSYVINKLVKYPDYKLKTYTVENKGKTPNSIANELYGNQIYSWILIIFNPYLSVIEYSIGDEIKYPDKVELNIFLNTI